MQLRLIEISSKMSLLFGVPSFYRWGGGEGNRPCLRLIMVVYACIQNCFSPPLWHTVRLCGPYCCSVINDKWHNTGLCWISHFNHFKQGVVFSKMCSKECLSKKFRKFMHTYFFVSKPWFVICSGLLQGEIFAWNVFLRNYLFVEIRGIENLTSHCTCCHA